MLAEQRLLGALSSPMHQLRHPLSLAFIALALADLAALAVAPSAHPFTKSLLMPVLAALHLALRRREAARGPGAWVLAALALSWAGDLLLLAPSLFLPGLGAFLFAHLALIVAYRRHRSRDQGARNWALAVGAISVAMGLALVATLVPKLGPLGAPVLAYAAVLVAMVSTAAARARRTSVESGAVTLAGATLFFLSDGLLAIDKFAAQIPHAGLFVMSTYDLGQLLIVVGLAAHRPNE